MAADSALNTFGLPLRFATPTQSSLWSSTPAAAAFFLTDSIPFCAADFELYISDCAIV